MKKHYSIPLFILMLSILLISCGGKKVMKTAQSFEPYKFDTSQYEPKVNNFAVILDTSSSMADKYQGQAKATVAKNFLTAMNQTLPEMNYNGDLRTFGNDAYLPDRSTMRVYGVTPYSASGFGSALDGVKGPGGDTSLPLAKAIAAAGEDFKSAKGPIAVVIVSDGLDMDQAPVKAAETLKSQFGDRLCIDTVQIGDDPAGKANLEQIAKIGGCGYATTADRLSTSSSMAGFVEGIFLAKIAPKPTPMAAAPKPLALPSSVVLFSFNSADIKSNAYPMLNEAAVMMKKNPDLNGRIDGYADSTGSEEYNIELSERRAKAVRDYLVSKGIDPERLSTKGFGVADPVASNDTKTGRAKNRRVELTPVQ